MIVCKHRTHVAGCSFCERIARTRVKATKADVANTADAPLVHIPELVTVPEFPPLRISPRSSQAVVTVVVGECAEQMHAISGPGQRRYAERLNADYVALRDPGPAGWPMGAKFGLARALDYYERIIYLDADVIVRDTALSLFEACDPMAIGAYNDWPEVLAVDPVFASEFHEFRKAMGFGTGPANPVPWYVNTGVLVLSHRHQCLFTPPTKPIPPWHCSEQHWWVARMLEAKTDVELLDRRCNWQWWADPGFSRTPPSDAVLHFSGWTGSHEARLMAMRKWS